MCPLSWLHKDLDELRCKQDAESCLRRRLCYHVILFAGALPEGDSGRGHRRWSGWEPGSRHHRPRGQWNGDHPLEPDAGHSEEARVHVASSAQDLVFSAHLHTRSVSSKTPASSCSFQLCPCLVTCSNLLHCFSKIRVYTVDHRRILCVVLYCRNLKSLTLVDPWINSMVITWLHFGSGPLWVQEWSTSQITQITRIKYLHNAVLLKLATCSFGLRVGHQKTRVDVSSFPKSFYQKFGLWSEF